MILWIDQEKQYDPEQIAKHVDIKMQESLEFSLLWFVLSMMTVLGLALIGIAVLLNAFLTWIKW
jgi:hypothetical protein